MHATIAAMLVTADSRAILKDALKRRLDGQADEVEVSLPCPDGLTQPEKSAWLMLQNWSCDAPLRARYSTHAEYSRNRLRHLLNILQ